MVYAKPSIFPGEWDTQTPMVFDVQTDHLIFIRRPDLIIITKKKRTCKIEDFTVPADHRVKFKESKMMTNAMTLLGNWKNCGTWKWRLCQL